MPHAAELPDIDTIHVSFLGGFKLCVGDRAINDSTGRTRQVWNLLEYLIAFRHKTISQSELIGALWPDEDSENPASALKNLVYRLRSLFLSKGVSFAKEIIILQNGVYHWNNRLPCVVDTEEFERLLRLAADVKAAPEERAARYLSTLALYDGDFLPGSGYEIWVVPLANYYRSLYFKGVYEVVDLLSTLQRYDEVRGVCEKAVLIDPFEERAHRELILALYHLNRPVEALSHYQYVTGFFYRELSAEPSEALRSLHQQIVNSMNHIETDLKVIKADLRENEIESGAYCCGYEVFRNLYRAEARVALRSERSVLIGLLSVSCPHGQIPPPSTLSVIMNHLLSNIRSVLRKGDVISRFSATQYMIMLSDISMENGSTVTARILRQFYAETRSKGFTLHAELQPLDPAS